jgi:hypothetical protein
MPRVKQMSTKHEPELIRAFVGRAHRDRYLSLLANPRKRGIILRRLAHGGDLDPRFIHRVPDADQTPERIQRMLVSRDAPERCFVVSENAALDGRELPLGEALRAVVGYRQGTLISCVPGRLAYYEAEESGERYILERPEGSR